MVVEGSSSARIEGHVRRLAPRDRARALAALAAVVVVWSAAWLAFALAPARPAIAIAAAFDFVVTAGVVLYALAIRRGALPRWVFGATIAIGLAFARVALGAAPDAGGVVLATGLALELALIATLVLRIRRARVGWRRARADGADGHAALIAALVAARLPPRVADIVATEVTLVALAVVGWRAPVLPADARRFTVHRTGSWSLVAGVVGFLVLVEAGAVHVVLATYASTTLAWVATALSLYSAIWLLGDALALRRGGAIVSPRGVDLRIGLRWRAHVPRAAIAGLEATTPGAALPADTLDLGILGATVRVSLNAPIEIHGLFGRRRVTRALALSIDDRDAFVAALRGS